MFKLIQVFLISSLIIITANAKLVMIDNDTIDFLLKQNYSLKLELKKIKNQNKINFEKLEKKIEYKKYSNNGKVENINIDNDKLSLINKKLNKLENKTNELENKTNELENKLYKTKLDSYKVFDSYVRVHNKKLLKFVKVYNNKFDEYLKEVNRINNINVNDLNSYIKDLNMDNREKWKVMKEVLVKKLSEQNLKIEILSKKNNIELNY